MSSRVLLQSGAESLILSFSLSLISREARINLRPQSSSVWEGGEGRGDQGRGNGDVGRDLRCFFARDGLGLSLRRNTHICVGFHSDCVCGWECLTFEGRNKGIGGSHPFFLR